MKKPDETLRTALIAAYMARAKLFHQGVKAAAIDLLIAEIDSIDDSQLPWDVGQLAITDTAWRNVEATRCKPHQVFAHPQVIGARPHLIAYYRNLVATSRKAVNQILFSTDKWESRKQTHIPNEQNVELCKTFNAIISGVIESVPDYSIGLSRKAILAEIGTELQGTWANHVGQGAARKVEEVLEQYIVALGFGRKVRRGAYELDNGWTISPEESHTLRGRNGWRDRCGSGS